MFDKKQYMKEYNKRPEIQLREKIRRNQNEYKEYQKIYQKKYYKNNQNYREYLKNYNRNFRLENPDYQKKRNLGQRMMVLIHYSDNPPKCACCGETEIKFLTVDHINNNGARDRKRIGPSHVFYRWLIKNNFPNGFQILCWNCNCGKRMNNGFCPHNYKLINMFNNSLMVNKNG